MDTKSSRNISSCNIRVFKILVQKEGKKINQTKTNKEVRGLNE